MKYRQLGKHGIRLSEIGFGSWLTIGLGIDDDTAKKCVETALEQGINFFDTADAYGLGEAEKSFGKILFKELDVKRQDIVLATKCFAAMSKNPNDRGLSRKHILESVENSLKRLRTDYIDIMQCHSFDNDTPLEETCSAFNDLITRGKIFYWGFSNWSAQNIEDALRVCEKLNLYRPVSSQPPYNILRPDIETNGIIDICEKNGIGQVIYSPLEQGILTGKYTGGKIPKGTRAADDKMNIFMKDKVTKEIADKVDRLKSLASELGVTLAQFAIAWCLRKKNVTSAITGASNKKQVVENCTAVDVVITEDLDNKIKSIVNS
jgi:voltage-dependent potassium channel beta subunit